MANYPETCPWELRSKRLCIKHSGRPVLPPGVGWARLCHVSVCAGNWLLTRRTPTICEVLCNIQGWTHVGLVVPTDKGTWAIITAPELLLWRRSPRHRSPRRRALESSLASAQPAGLHCFRILVVHLHASAHLHLQTTQRRMLYYTILLTPFFIYCFFFFVDQKPTLYGLPREGHVVSSLKLFSILLAGR